MLIFVSDNLKKLAKIFPVDLYIVGGYVRNQIMGLPKTDVDLCGQLKLEEVSSLLQGSMFSFKVKNKALGTGVICDGNEEYEYSCFREEEYAEGGERTPTKVNFIKDVKQDAKRRDFTCNSLYYDIKKDKILDFYGGIEDIKHKILKTISGNRCRIARYNINASCTSRCTHVRDRCSAAGGIFRLLRTDVDRTR